MRSDPTDRPLLTAVRAALEPLTNTTLVVGVSGGPDSLCLLHLLTRVAPKARVALHVAHLDHAFRRDSPGDARFVEQIAREWDLPATVARRAPPKSSEEAARETRYAFFSEVAKATGATAVAVGHTADDQAETVLLHLIRGSGLTGLAGMWPDTELNGLRVVRPLLGVLRAETHAYCQRHGIPYRDDPSNHSPRFTRNRVRSELLPLLRQFNPKVDEALLRLAAAAQAEEAFWRWFLPHLPRESLKALPRAVQTRVLKEAYRRLTNQSLEGTHIESLLSLVPGKRASLPGGVQAETERGRLVLRKTPIEKPAPWTATILNIPGETSAGPWKVLCKIVTAPFTLPDLGCLLPISSQPLTLRPRGPGDRYRPTGMPAPKKLQDILVDTKVPRRLRDLVPVLEGPSGILWVGGHRIAEEARLTTDTDIALELRLEPLTDPARELTRLYT